MAAFTNLPVDLVIVRHGQSEANMMIDMTKRGDSSAKEAMREAIRKERRVELFLENTRYFDARRWKIAEDVFAGEMHGMDINARSEEDFYKKLFGN